MDFITKEIGSARENSKSPIHNWYKFTAGFSYRFVDGIIKLEKLKPQKSIIYEPFAGCGTTLVSSQKNRISAVGNEGQVFMFDIIRAKLYWQFNEDDFKESIEYIKKYVNKRKTLFKVNKYAHPLLVGLYTEESLKILYLIKDAIQNLTDQNYQLFFKLALSQTLHKVAIHPLASPYISRHKTLSNTDKAWEFFEKISTSMFEDTKGLNSFPQTSKIYLHDSRKKNQQIEDNSCSICVTSPPYLNNMDYGEISKVHTHFFNITSTWGEITEKVRKNLVTGATTHYTESKFSLDEFKESEFYLSNKTLANALIKSAFQMKEVSKLRAGKKSFDILSLLYFKDMYDVLKETRRILEKRGKAYLILGDSAPYGVFIPTTEYLGKISKSVGFKKFEIHKIRSRGTKWKSLVNRHSLELSENVLILR
jgi:DNA modification methylase